MHQAFCLCGPTIARMRRFESSVTSVIRDLGEAATKDIPDMSAIYLRGNTPERWAELKGTHFFPNSILVSGPSHFCDWILYCVLTRLPPDTMMDFLSWYGSPR